jgi:hypothetical protein
MPADAYGSLLDLSRSYASGADRRDVHKFLRAFADDGVLSIYAGSDPEEGAVRTARGHTELASIPRELAAYARTFHLLGQASYDVAGDRATGEVYCVAHHLSVRSEPSYDRVLYIRYVDDYHRSAAAWKISQRRVLIDWTEILPAQMRGSDKGEAT